MLGSNQLELPEEMILTKSRVVIPEHNANAVALTYEVIIFTAAGAFLHTPTLFQTQSLRLKKIFN